MSKIDTEASTSSFKGFSFSGLPQKGSSKRSFIDSTQGSVLIYKILEKLL